MVALGHTVPATNESYSLRYNTPLLATSPICSAGDLFPVPKWAPRSGRGPAYAAWHRAIQQLLAAFGLAASDLAKSVPTLDSYLSQMASPYAGFAEEGDVPIELRRRHRALVESWRAVNTAIYWHVLPSLNLVSIHQLVDERAVDSLSVGNMAHGRGLILWANGKVALDDPNKQLRLRDQLAKFKLGASASRADLLVHAERLYQLWQLVLPNDPASPRSMVGYWLALLDTMATTSPAASRRYRGAAG